jgi:two-component system sensor histidine kinase BaeS
LKLGVTHKAFFAILTATFLAVLSFALIMQWSLHQGFLKFINATENEGAARLAVSLENDFKSDPGWQHLHQAPERWRDLVFSSFAGMQPANGAPPPLAPPGGDGFPGRERHLQSAPFMEQPPHHFAQRLLLLDPEKKVLIGQAAALGDTKLIPLKNGGTTVGFLGIRPQTRLPDRPHRRFMEEQKVAFVIAAGLVVLLSAVVALFLATILMKPLKRISEATNNLAQGDFSVRVPVDSGDELGRLATNFNALALALEDNARSRRQWVADISHELRTPLTFLRSQVEAILDGVRSHSRESTTSLHSEIMRLQRLVDDLYQLAMSDVGSHTYRKEELELALLVGETASAFAPAFAGKEIAFDCEVAAAEARLLGDPDRLRQLFNNLLENSLKYTDPGGTVRFRLAENHGAIQFDVEDSAPGVPEADRARLFDRLFRVDSSRSRVTGGAGLGLAICKNIVEAHDGCIEARDSALGGVWIHGELPSLGRGR